MLALAAIGIASILLPQPAVGAEDDGQVLVLGRISDNPKAHYEQLKPLLDYVVPRMAGVGIRRGRILMARDAQQMASYLRRGRVDWLTETSGTGMLLQQRATTEPLLLTERNGVSHYHTVFFVRRDSGIAKLADLRGHSIAFQSSYSTSAYLVPAAKLLEAGLTLEILLSPGDRASSDAVGYLFGRSELNISTWVHKRLVDVGTMSNLDWTNPQRVPPSYRRDLKVIHRTPAYPRALEMVRHDLDPRVRERLREVLAGAASDPAAREALLRVFNTTRFLPVDAAAQQALRDMRTGVVRVRAEVE
ncbi:MAG TPA: phosphate/phosphite/phosphonate ABC transporter substrate-binding protein [Xanthomonadaceae bacterium]|nr:phosphate/phosphite/phosphonate ABC transporter substrate-binding protein [Xanthomonadaceae bacterium]